MTTKLSLLITSGLIVAIPAFAQVALDDDNAARAVYSDGITNFENGSTTGAGSGFGGWVFGDNLTVGDDFTSVATNNGGSTSIDTAGQSFRLVDQSAEGAFIDVFRFLDDGELGVGQTFSIQLDVNFRSGSKGIRVRDTDDSSSLFRFEVGNLGSGDDYTILDAASGNGSIGTGYSDDSIFTISLSQTSPTGGSWTVERSGGIMDTDTGTFSGQVSSFQLYNRACPN